MNEILEYPLYIHPNKDKKKGDGGVGGGARACDLYQRAEDPHDQSGETVRELEMFCCSRVSKI